MLLLNEWKELSPGKISESLDIKPSTTTRFLDKLQKLGYITRRVEGKYSYISLSSIGMSKLPEIQGVIETLEVNLSKLVTSKVAERQKVVFNEIAERIKEKEKK
jgi:DNA-binding MarR family transcriptional regulator